MRSMVDTDDISWVVPDQLMHSQLTYSPYSPPSLRYLHFNSVGGVAQTPVDEAYEVRSYHDPE